MYVAWANAGLNLRSTDDVDDGCCCSDCEDDCYDGRWWCDNCCRDSLRVDGYSDNNCSTKSLEDPYQKLAPSPCLHAVAPGCYVSQREVIEGTDVPRDMMVMVMVMVMKVCVVMPCCWCCC